MTGDFDENEWNHLESNLSTFILDERIRFFILHGCIQYRSVIDNGNRLFVRTNIFWKTPDTQCSMYYELSFFVPLKPAGRMKFQSGVFRKCRAKKFPVFGELSTEFQSESELFDLIKDELEFGMIGGMVGLSLFNQEIQK